ncbi:LamG-like jellyroll fold domain-containing protein [Cognataquiflexum rubidum]|uniref:LamG-like jellyroll fold domain-containing protein n=1 Tax=Cognataquiflexum rubidum TaxID=2922273 RepID=UPI001F13105E|nr:LamG-like jellyroll fold domain-containing protein [Cognataquiflexum rubidum]MCH6236796.1 Ig-like domain-containing protein [Cognataquiflexum rubidum]
MKTHFTLSRAKKRFFLLFLFTFSFQFLLAQSVQFDLASLNFNGYTPPSSGTSLKFGPDNRLYVSQLNGLIRIYTIENAGFNSYRVTGTESISLVRSIPNYDDTGTRAWDKRSNRQITGIEVTGTAANPIIYVGSSDPRWGGPTGDKVLDTNSGIITRLTWTGTNWDAVDLVRGLPRSEENHSTNAVTYTIINGKPFLLVASGGFTNAGAPSTSFTWITEYALAAALLSIDLDAIEALPLKIDPISGRKFKYDIPTLDDPSRPNVNGIYNPNQIGYDGIDVGDPFGGNDGLNMGMIVEGGPVQIFSGGYRNAYDFVVTEGGKVFVTDNGPNTNWGGLPENEGNPNTVTNNYPQGEPGGNSSNRSASGEWVRNQDHLLLITQDINSYQPGSFYGGHPTPIRANPGIPYTKGSAFPFNPGGAGLYTKSIGDEYFRSLGANQDTLKPLYTQNEIFRTQILEPIAPGQSGFDFYAQNSLPVNWPPVPVSLANSDEADYRDPSLTNPNGPQPKFVTIWKKNSNGIDEYKASNFNGVLKGSLIGGRNEGFLHLVRLNPDGTLLSLEEDKWNLNGGNALGITCQADNDVFPGTIWVATFDSRISILTPSNIPFCPPPGDPFFDPNADYDNDGFTNQDEIDNGTDYCDGASSPNDFDRDFISDLNDLDDDGDSIPDAMDPFQLGNPSNLPINNELFSDKTDELGRPFGYRGLGLTGLMNNGSPNPNWLNWLDKPGVGSLPDDIFGGAAGAIQIAMTGGTATGMANTQEKGFQFGVNVGTETGNFLITGVLLGFQGPQMFYDIDHEGELGIQMGDGTQSNFLKLVFTKTGILAALEVEDVPDPSPLFLPLSVEDRPLSSETVSFLFKVDPILGTVEPQIKIGNRNIISLGIKNLSGKVLQAVQDITKPLAVGVFGTSADPTKEFLTIYDSFKVDGEQPYLTNQIPDITRQVSSPPREIDLSEFFGDNFGVENLSFSYSSTILSLTGVQIEGNMLTLTFPDSPYTGVITVRATDSFGYFVEQSFEISVVRANQIIYRINAGGQEVIGENNAPNWVPNDQNGSFDGIGYSVNGGTSSSSSLQYANKHASIPSYISEPTFNSIFGSQREKTDAGNLRYTIPLSNGVYIINLYLGENGAGQVNINERKFDIRLEGITVRNNLDLVQKYGKGVAAVEQFEIEVSDGQLNIEFVKRTGNPIINAIEIIGTTLATPINFIVPIPDQVNTINEELEGTLLCSAIGGVGTLLYSATNLPPGIDIEPVNGRLYGTVSPSAQANQTYNVTIWVTDSNSPVPNQEFTTFSWTILPFENWNIANENQNYTERHEASFVQAGESFYVMGGRENSKTIDVYDYHQDSWRALSGVAPVSFNHFQATEYKGYIWVIGAFEDNLFPNEKPATHIWMFDPVTEQYIQGPKIPDGLEDPNDPAKDRRRGSAGLVVYKDKFYLIGGNKLGHNGQYVNYFDEFDPATGSWSIMPDAPRPRDHFHAAVIGDKIYVASGRLSGGLGGTFGPVIPEVDVYDFVTGTWSTLPNTLNLPTPRAAAVVANFKNKLLIAGGEIPGVGNELASNITEIFDPQTQTWSAGPNLNFRRHGTQGIVSGEGLFVAGGSPNRGSGRQRNMEFFGLNNPFGTPVSKSLLSGPNSVSMLNGISADFELNFSGGNQGLLIREITFKGVDSGDFTVEFGAISNALKLPNSSHTVRIKYGGIKDNPVANVLIKYDLNLELEIPITNSVLRVENFTMINPENNLDVALLEENSQIQLSQINSLGLNFRANTNPSSVGSVFLSLTGPVTLSRFDDEIPYTLLMDGGINLPLGNYNVIATPYSGIGGTGTAGKPLSIQFAVVENIISNFPVTGISISPTNTSIQAGVTQQLNATVSPSNATNKTVLWTSSNPQVATVNSSGLVSGVSVGNATITGRTEDGNFTSTSAVTVTQASIPYSIAGFVLINAGNNSELLTLVNGTQLLSSQVGSLSLNIKVNTNPVTVGSVFISLSGPVNETRTENGAPYALFGDSNGIYSGKTLPNGNYTLSAIAYSGSFRSGTVGPTTTIQFSIVSSASIPVSGISVTPNSASIQAGSTRQLTATVSPTNATNTSVTWSTSNPLVATVNTSGLVTGVTVGTAIISATTVDGNFTAVSNISIEGTNSDVGLVGHWKMEENGGNILIDHSGMGNNATVGNTSGMLWVNGQEGLAIRLNGASSFGNVAHNSSLAFTNELTVAAWIKPTALAKRTIISKGTPDGFFLMNQTNGKIEFRFNGNANGTTYRLQSNQNYPINGSWMHVAVTFNGTKTVMYINGVEDKSATYAPVAIRPNTTNLQIGAWDNMNRWAGDLDEVRLYGRALTSTEILGLMGSQMEIPATPILSSPANGIGSITYSGPLLGWNTSDFAQAYRVEMAKSTDFSNPIAVGTGIQVASFQCPQLDPNTLYYWRVRASNQKGDSPWSETWSFTTAAENQNESNLVGFWKMEENGGNILIDHSGNGNNATVGNTSGVSWINGQEGLAIRLSGNSNNFGSVPHNTSLAFTNEITVAAWIKPSALAKRTIISKGTPDGFFLMNQINGKIEFRFNGTTNGTTYRLRSNQNYPTNGSWMHVAVTFNGTKTVMYINGVEDNSATYAPVTIRPNTTNLQIGAWDNINRWTGDLDEVRLYGKALSSSEILGIFSSQNSNFRTLAAVDKNKPVEELQTFNQEIPEDSMLGFKVYPNPVENLLIIQMNSKDQIQVDLIVYDMMGRQYINRSAITENGEIVLDLASIKMAAGTYLLMLDQGNGKTIQVRFIKK